MVQKAKEDDLYGVVRVFGKTFEIYYGYYEEYERHSKYNDPVPIYPDLIKDPQYDGEGRPIVTEMQVACEHYRGHELRTVRVLPKGRAAVWALRALAR